MTDEAKKGAAVISIAWSKDRLRTELRRPSDGGTPMLPEPTESGPVHAPGTTRFAPGNQAWKRRELKRRAKGITTLNPASCPAWMRPHVVEGATYGQELAARFDSPALARLVGDTADAHAVFKALITLGAQGDGKALTEARGWLREHRACLRELAALAGAGVCPAEDDAIPPGFEADDE